MTVIASTVLDRAGQSLGEGLPRIAAGLILLVLGVVLVRLLTRLLARALTALDVDDLGERAGIHDALARVGFERSLARAVVRAVRLALTVVVILAALTLLGLGFLQDSINQSVLFLPRVLVALALLLAGAVLGTLIRDRADRIGAQMDLPGPVGQIAEVTVFAVFGLSALGQIGVGTSVLTALVALLIAGAVVAFALAFGLGGRDVARAVSAGRIVRDAYAPGQTITVAGVRGEIVAVEPSATVLHTPAGTTVRVPNHLLLESIVELHPAG